jgi:hypothetical protein
MTLAKRVQFSSYIRALVCGFPNPRRGKRPILMLQAFIDDSGTGGQPPVFVLAGFVATADEWAAFSDEWQESLEMRPALNYFKMSEAMNFQGEFSGWSEQSRNDRVARLYRIIENHARAGISTVVSHAAYEKVFGSPRLPRPMQDPYYLLFFDLIAQVARSQREWLRLDDTTDFIFDDQVGKKDRLVGAWESFKAMASPAFKEVMGDTPIFRDDKNVLPLQAADFHAWLVRKRWEEVSLGRQRAQMPWVTKRDIPSIAVEWAEPQLRTVYSTLFENEIPNEVLFELRLSRGSTGRIGPLGGRNLP